MREIVFQNSMQAKHSLSHRRQCISREQSLKILGVTITHKPSVISAKSSATAPNVLRVLRHHGMTEAGLHAVSCHSWRTHHQCGADSLPSPTANDVLMRSCVELGDVASVHLTYERPRKSDDNEMYSTISVEWAAQWLRQLIIWVLVWRKSVHFWRR